MAALVCFVLMLAMVGASEGAWCVCRSDVSDSALQKTLDYACGAGADCNTIHQGGACFNPNTVRAHCSYAANSYYQRKGQAQQACDFSGTATLTNSDPSGNGCTYPASASAAGSSSSSSSSNTPTSSSNTPTSSSSSNTPTSGSNSPGSSVSTTGSTTPNTLIPTTGSSTGGILGGLGPSGNSISSTDTSGATASSLSFCPKSLMMASLIVVLVLSALI